MPDPLINPPGYTYITFAGLDEQGRLLAEPQGEPGEYEVTFTLLQPGQAAERVKGSGMVREWEVQNEKIEGDSHLALTLPKDARFSSNAEAGFFMTVGRLDGSSEDMQMLLQPNRDGRLSKVAVTLHAENFSQAERRAYFETASHLSYVAFELDIPLHVAHTFIKETRTSQVRVGFVRQFGYKGIGNLLEQSRPARPEPFPALASIYREGLNSESPFYQLLCFCRIVQRLINPLRPRWKNTIVEHDKRRLPRYEKSERFPEEEEQAERYPAAIRGKKFTRVYDDHLRPLRDGIAHVFLSDEDDRASDERSTDEFEFVEEVYDYVPVAHHAARIMLENDFGERGLATIARRLVED